MIDFSHLNLKVDDKAYGDMLKELSQLIGRSFIATKSAFERLKPEQVASIVENSKKWQERKFKSRSMMIWTERKKLLE